MNTDPQHHDPTKPYLPEMEHEEIPATTPQPSTSEHNEEVYLPPYVVNQFDPPLPQSQTVDWGLNKLGITTIHESGLTGRGIKIAVIDTGIPNNPEHPDLVGAVIKYINVTGETVTGTNGHGIGVAGCIAARNNTSGVLGVAPNSQIVAIKAMRETGSGDLTEIVRGIDAAIAEGVHIINMSLGTSSDASIMRAAVKRATDKGIIVVCSAGNAGQADSVMYPARYENTIAVAATNEAGNVSAFSSQGWDVDISAPGERILTCWRNNTYAKVSGTSFSAPILSGVLALFLEAKLLVNNERLGETAIDIEDVGKDVKSGYGLVNPAGYLTKYTPPPTEGDPLLRVKEAKAILEQALAGLNVANTLITNGNKLISEYLGA